MPKKETLFIQHLRDWRVQQTSFRVQAKLAPAPAARSIGRNTYTAGDLVTWRVGVHLPHIGIVVDRRSPDGERPLVVHNMGRGPKLEDMLFDYPITGHYRYYDKGRATASAKP